MNHSYKFSYILIILGEDMNAWTDEVKTYNWWFNTYPLEFGEFLLVTALTRGVWLHPLSANDLGYQHIDIFADDIHEDQIGLF